MANATHKGSCLCQQVKFLVEGDPFNYIVCHCPNCRKASGSSFMVNPWFKKQNVTIEGDDYVKEYVDSNTASGRRLSRNFCSNCGSTLFLRPKDVPNSDLIIIPIGLFDGPIHWVPRKEYFPEQKHPWLKEITLRAENDAKKGGKL